MYVKEIEYKKHKFILQRKVYKDLPPELQVTEVGQIIQQADNPYDEEFTVTKIKDKEVFCIDNHTHIHRCFYLDSVRISEKELKRQKRARILAKKAESQRKKQEKEKKRAERIYRKSLKENARKHSKLKKKTNGKFK